MFVVVIGINRVGFICEVELGLSVKKRESDNKFFRGRGKKI